MKFQSSNKHQEDALILYTQKKNLKIQRGADVDEDNAHHHHLGVTQAKNSTTSTKCKIENSQNHFNACMCQ
jgi:hypothetical protein